MVVTGLEPHITAGLIQEVYNSVRIAVKVTKTAKNNVEERAKLIEDFEDEYLFVETFGKLLEEREWKVVRDTDLNTRWMTKVNKELEQLKAIFAEYAELGAKVDKGYKEFSSLALEVSSPQNLLTFGNFVQGLQKIDQQESDNAIVTAAQSRLIISSNQNSRPGKGKESKFDLRFSLYEKGKLESILKKCVERTTKLREIQAVMQTANTTPVVVNVIVNGPLPTNPEQALLPYQRLREITNEPESPTSSIPIKPAINLALKGFKISPDTGGLWRLIPTNGIGKQLTVMVETKIIEGEDKVKTDNTENIKKLAKLLTNSEEKLGTLNFLGYFQDDSKFDFVFGFPKDSQQSRPTTLNDLLVVKGLKAVTLPMRFHMARQAASYLFQLHASKWIHKSIQSKSLWFFNKGSITNLAYGLDYKRPYFANFEYARAISSHTMKTADDDLDRNLYRHPERQNKPTKDFNKLHDLYSLGVILLEIGLWKTVKQIRADMDFVDEEMVDYVSPDGKPLGEDLKKALTIRANSELPNKMGKHYKDAVCLCLTGNFGVAEMDDDFEYVVKTEVVDNLSIEKLNDDDDDEL